MKNSERITAIEFMMKSSWVKRYHTEPRVEIETVGHHSHGVAAILTILYEDASANLLRAAIVHDLEEWVTGDMPAPAKRNMGVKEIFHEYGQKVRRQVGLPIPELTELEEIQLKFADNLHGAISSLREMSLGNRFASEPFHNFINYMREMNHKLTSKEIVLTQWLCQESVKYDWIEDGR